MAHFQGLQVTLQAVPHKDGLTGKQLQQVSLDVRQGGLHANKVLSCDSTEPGFTHRDRRVESEMAVLDELYRANEYSLRACSQAVAPINLLDYIAAACSQSL